MCLRAAGQKTAAGLGISRLRQMFLKGAEKKNQEMRRRNEEMMSIRDLGVIEITVFMVVLAAFLVFFGLFVMLRHQKARSRRQKFSRKQLAMEEAVQQKMSGAPEEEYGTRWGRRRGTEREEEYAMFAPPEQNRPSEPGTKHRADVFDAEDETKLPKEKAYSSKEEETLRMWDSNSKAVRTVKKAKKEAGQAGTFFVEERRISHRRDQLKRLEEAK